MGYPRSTANHSDRFVTHRCIVHADMDAFFASIEIRDQPRLRGLPVIVGGVSARGVVCAASYEARKFGVKSAMPMYRARQLCPHARYLPPNMAKYAQVSREIHAIFLEFTSDIEPIAFDEAYLDVTASLALYHGPLELGRELKRRVYSATELVVSVGIGPNKLVAKIACTSGKPNGLVVIVPEAVENLLEPLPVRQLWGIGPVTERALLARGMNTIGDLRRATPEQLQPLFGARTQEIVQMAWGHDPRQVEVERENRSIGEESTFEADTLEPDLISAVITAHSETVAHRLRQLRLKAHTITLKVKLAKPRGMGPDRNSASDGAPQYPLMTRSKTLSKPIQDGSHIRTAALELWQRAQLAEPVRLIGVSASQFDKAREAQLELFSTDRKSEQLGRALDAIQERFGPGAIRRAVDRPKKMTPSQQSKPGEPEPKRRR